MTKGIDTFLVELQDAELVAVQGGMRRGITLDVEPNDTIQNIRSQKPEKRPAPERW